jgi:outer membrane lipoprotein SlyB
METQASKSPHPMVWVAAIAVVVFCGAGAAAFMGWIPSSTAKSGDEAKLAKLDAPKTSAAHRAATKTHSAPLAARCSECGVVQSVREIDTKGEGSGLGAVGGAVAGGVLGHQVGNGDGNTIATVIGAVGGAVAGNEVEKRVKTTKSYQITVRLEDGSIRVISEANATSWRSGDKVKLVNGVIHSNA